MLCILLYSTLETFVLGRYKKIKIIIIIIIIINGRQIAHH